MPVKKFDVDQARFRAKRIFHSGTPLTEGEFFAGRIDELQRILKAHAMKGVHIVVYGQRGVGKTSLCNILHEKLKIQDVAKTTVESGDTFGSIWMRLLSKIVFQNVETIVGFRHREEETQSRISDFIPDPSNVSVTTIADLISASPVKELFIIDEYDRLRDEHSRQKFTDLIKILADRGSTQTICLVGVADDIQQLIQDHPSIERSLVQIMVDPMTKFELKQVLTLRWDYLGMTYTKPVLEIVTSFCQGYPHIAHVIGLHVTLQALSKDNDHIDMDDVFQSMSDAALAFQQSLHSAYECAVASPQLNAKFARTLLVAALVHTDELGYFRASDLLQVYKIIEGAEVKLQSFNRHLGELCSEKRNQSLVSKTVAGNTRYAFANPMLKAFVIVRACAREELTYKQWVECQLLPDNNNK
ncbi:MAG: ATP-binding protein [Fimbriimonadaceae bacterium]|nr:MAG: ATP-binding protein [Fimbriimonadaceae bacterium]